jgi:CelD/BcsL family acetyltransferase involved in cellulose biosynthesis
MTSDIITDGAALERLRPDWNALVMATPAATPFLTWEWMTTWWRHVGIGSELFIVTVRDDDGLVAIAPWFRKRTWALNSRLHFLGTGGAGSDYLDVIVRPGAEDQAIDAIARALDGTTSTLHLDHLPAASMSERLSPALGRTGWTPLQSRPDVCPFIELSGHTFDSYLRTLGASHRANFRRRLRELQRRFAVSFSSASDGQRSHALNRLFHFHRERWGGRGSTAFTTMPLRGFHHDVSRQFRDAGWLRLFTLKLDGETAAVMYGFVLNGRFYFYQHGFAAAFAQYGVGLVLMGLTIKSAIEEACVEFDMLYGREPYKYLWARAERPLSRLQLFPPRLAGRLLRRQAETRLALRGFALAAGLRRSHAHS